MAGLFSACNEDNGFPTDFEEKQQLVDTLLDNSQKARNAAPLSIIPLADSTIKIATEINYHKGQLGGYYNKAVGHFFLNNYSDAIEWCDHVILLTQELNPDSIVKNKYLGSAYNLKGIIWQKKGEYATAVENLLAALDYFEANKDFKNAGTVYTNISENFRFMKDFEKAMEYNKKAESFMQSEEMVNKLTTVFQNRGNIYNNQGDFEAALQMFQMTLERARKHNDIENITHSLNNLGVSYEEMGKDNEALEYYFRALDHYKARKHYWGEANTLGNISVIYLKRREFEKAVTFTNNALEISRENDFRELTLYNYKNLGRIYETMGQFRQSLEINKQIGLLKDSLYNEEKFRTINSLEQKYKEEKAEKLIAQKDKELIQAQLNSKTLLIFLIIFGVVILLSLVIAFFLYKQVQLKKRNNEALRKKNAIIEKNNQEITQQRDEIQNQKEDLELLVNAYETHGAKELNFGKRKIPINDIIYIKYHNRISHAFLKDGRIIEHRVQLSQLSSELKYKSNFLFGQINQNYIVNFNNVNISFFNGEDEKFYYTNYLDYDHEEGRTEDFVKTRKRSALNKNFEREYKRYLRLKSFLASN